MALQKITARGRRDRALGAAASYPGGLAALLPSQRGPKAGHKLSGEVIAFATELKAAKPELTTSQCLDAIESRFGIKVHRRSLERALARKKTKSSVIVASVRAAAVYEELRAPILSGKPAATPGLGILRRQGLAAWMRALRYEPCAEATCHDPEPSSSAKPDLSPPAHDVTRLIAGILVSLAMEPMHA